MCPLCIGTATLFVSGGTSAAGLVALVLRRLTRKKQAPRDRRSIEKASLRLPNDDDLAPQPELS